MRIVSLLPSATEIVCALGYQKDLVGRSHECDYPPGVERLPIVTEPHLEAAGSSGDIDRRVKELVRRGLSLYSVDVEKLKELGPDVIVTQSQCEVCAVSEGELEQALSHWVEHSARIVSLKPDSLDDIWEDFRKVGRAMGDVGAAEDLIKNIQKEIKKVRSIVANLENRPKVLCLEWLDPLMAAGNWMPELVAMAGGSNLMGTAGAHSPYVSWEEVRRSDPEVLLILPCGFDIARSKKEMNLLTRLPGWGDLSATVQGRVFIADGNQYFNRPGPRILDSFYILAELLHPNEFPPRYEGKGWIRIST